MNAVELKSTLRKLQLTQLEILKEIDAFCRKNNIKYSLYAGSLLGAVRHKGFIPWDDDLDICMERKEYDKFIRMWLENKPDGYILQNKEIEANFSQSFTKIRKDHTTFLQKGETPGLYHTGIFVDVFPIDRMPNGRIAKAVFWLRCMIYQLYTREFIPPKASTFTKIIAGILLKTTTSEHRKEIRNKLLKKIRKYDINYKLNPIAIETVASMHSYCPVNMLDSFTFLKFEDDEFMCFEAWDEYLKCKYGDYRKLPPKGEQNWKHCPVILDFEHNYEEIHQ